MNVLTQTHWPSTGRLNSATPHLSMQCKRVRGSQAYLEADGDRKPSRRYRVRASYSATLRRRNIALQAQVVKEREVEVRGRSCTSCDGECVGSEETGAIALGCCKRFQLARCQT